MRSPHHPSHPLCNTSGHPGESKPQTISEDSCNTSNYRGHTHEIERATTEQAGIVKLNNTLTSEAVHEALTAAQGKELAERIQGLTQESQNEEINRRLEAALGYLSTRYNAAYPTYDRALSRVSVLPNNALVYVVNDPDETKNGLYYVDALSLIKAPFDALSTAFTTDAMRVFQSVMAEAPYTELTYNGVGTYSVSTIKAVVEEFKAEKEEKYLEMFDRADIAIEELIRNGMVRGFATEALLKQWQPAYTGARAKADDTKKVWRWEVTSATGVTPITGNWVDTGLSELDQAKAYADSNKSFNLSIKLNDGENFITEAQAKNNVLYFVGDLTSEATVIFPKHRANYIVQNLTTGGFNVYLKTLDQVENPIFLNTTEGTVVFNTSAQVRSTTNLKANLNSPVFSGEPMSPTPPREKIGNYIATTKFLKDQMEYPYLSSTTINVTSITSDILLTEQQLERSLITFSGTLSQNLNVIIPASHKKQFFIQNATNGGFKLLFKTTQQTLGAVESETGSTLNLFVVADDVYAAGTEKANLRSPTFTGTPRTPTAIAETNDTTIASTAFARRVANSVSAVTVDNTVTALTQAQVAYKVIRISGMLTADLTINFPVGIGKWTIINNTTGGFSLFFKGLDQTSGFVEVKSGSAEEVYLYSGVLRKVPYSSSSRGVTEIPVATANILGGIKVGSGLNISQSGVLSAAPQSALSLQNVGKFKEGGSYIQGQIVEHGSGVYEVKSNITNALTPFNNPSFNKISHNYYAGSLRSLTPLSVTKTDKTQAHFVPYFMTNDGMTVMGKEGRYQNVSYDYGQTWQNNELFDFGARTGVKWIKQTGDNELLVCTYTTVDDAPVITKVWKSTGWKSFYSIKPTWEVVFEFQKKGVYLADWGFSQHNNIILMTDYGYKHGVDATVDAETYARYVYMSKDFGKTWTTIFDLSDYTDGIGVHMHGSCYDPYWGRIWTSYGDASFGSNGLFYSDDLGKTWTSATQTQNAGINFPQSVHIVALPTCLLLCSDSYPNGIHRIDRAQGKIPYKGYYTIESAYMIPDQLERLNHLFHHTAKAEWMPDSPWLFVWGSETQAGKSGCVATFDGWSFHEVWVSEYNSTTGYGGRTVLGVTPENEIIIGCDDPANGENSWYEVRVKVAID